MSSQEFLDSVCIFGDLWQMELHSKLENQCILSNLQLHF